MPVSVTTKCSIVQPSPRASSRTSTQHVARASVNLIALPTRLTSTCRSRPGSPTIAGGHVRRRCRTMQLEPLLVGLHGERLEQIGRPARASENGIASSSSLRDSIFEKSRMSLRIASSDSADDLTVVEVVALLGVSSRVERQLGHADDAVHRRADLVAHVGEELALGAAGFHGLVARRRHVGVERAQFGRARLDCRFEALLLLQQLRVALLDLVEHLVEAVDEHRHLVVAPGGRRLGAHVVAPLAGDDAGDVGQPQQRDRNDALQPRSNRECEPQGGEQHEAHNLSEAGGAARDPVQVRLDDHRADDVVAQVYRPSTPPGSRT